MAASTSRVVRRDRRPPSRSRGSSPRCAASRGRRCRCSRSPPRNATPGFATVSSKGYRFTTTRSMSSIPFCSGLGEMLGLVAPGQEPAMDLRVERLHPPLHDLREARVLAHLGHGKALLPEHAGRAPGREQRVAVVPHEGRGEVRQAPLVADREKGEFSHGWGRLCGARAPGIKRKAACGASAKGGLLVYRVLRLLH